MTDNHLVPEARGLAQMLGDLAVEMQSLTDSRSTLEAIVSAAVDIVPGASWAGISLASRRKVTAEIRVHDVAARLDRLQTDLREGPALSVLRERHTVLIDDLAAETRWSSFTSTALTLGVHSLLSFRLFVVGESLGVLELYGATAHAFTSESVVIGEVFAQHAAVAMAGAASTEQMQSALATRDVIGQAKGMLMERYGVNAIQAFDLLRKLSQDSNTPLIQIATDLVEKQQSSIE